VESKPLQSLYQDLPRNLFPLNLYSQIHLKTQKSFLAPFFVWEYSRLIRNSHAFAREITPFHLELTDQYQKPPWADTSRYSIACRQNFLRYTARNETSHNSFIISAASAQILNLISFIYNQNKSIKTSNRTLAHSFHSLKLGEYPSIGYVPSSGYWIRLLRSSGSDPEIPKMERNRTARYHDIEVLTGSLAGLSNLDRASSLLKFLFSPRFRIPRAEYLHLPLHLNLLLTSTSRSSDLFAATSHRGKISSRQYFIAEKSHRGHISSRPYLIAEKSHRGKISSRKNLIAEKSRRGKISSRKNLIAEKSHRGESHRGKISSRENLIAETISSRKVTSRKNLIAEDI
jgi:hypothetical protein